MPRRRRNQGKGRFMKKRRGDGLRRTNIIRLSMGILRKIEPVFSAMGKWRETLFRFEPYKDDVYNLQTNAAYKPVN